MKNFYIKAQAPTGWVRPSDWIAIPSIANNEEVIYILMAVTDQSSNHIAFLVQGAYTVDWGDGSAPVNYATNTQAEYNYTYGSLPIGTTTTNNGATIRQTLIKITPQAANNITLINFQRTHTALPSAGVENYKVLDMVFNIPNITGSTSVLGGAATRYNYCQRVWIKQIGAITSLSSFFANFSSLENLPLFETSSVTNFNSCFQSCTSLMDVPLLNTSACINLTSMFASCVSLVEVPLFNLSNVTSTSNMFAGCSSLKFIPAFNLSSCTSLSTMFNGCINLQYVPVLNTALVTTVGNMFPACSALLSFEATDMSLVTVNITWLNGTNSLEKLILPGLRIGFNITDSNMGATELNALFTSLGIASGAQTITVTGNIGAATCDTSIATGKGYTVVT